MSSFESKISMDMCVRGLAKNQDLAFNGKSDLNGESFDYGIILDGHGSDEFIRFMRRLDWVFIVSCDDPWGAIHPILIENSHLNGGSTLIIMRAFANRIDVISVGDSGILIYKNNELIYTNEKHTNSNSREQERLKSNPLYRGLKKPVDSIPLIRNPHEMQAKRGYYNYFGPDYDPKQHQLAMTQSMGHGNITGYDPERHVESFEETDSIKIVMGSDGLFDMLLLEQSISKLPELTSSEMEDLKLETIDILSMTATELVEKTERRWKKEDWAYHWHIKDYSQVMYPISFDGGYDDISAITWNKH
jgi:serine/threonine protein phosphatase PrpC